MTSFAGDEDCLSYIEEKLDRRHLPANQMIPNFIMLEDCLDYDIGSGLFIKIEQAFGLQCRIRLEINQSDKMKISANVSANNLYCSCFARINQGLKTINWAKSAEGFGADYKFIVNKHDYASLQTSPRWIDKPYV